MSQVFVQHLTESIGSSLFVVRYIRSLAMLLTPEFDAARIEIEP